MNITVWSYALFSLFNAQYSYKANHDVVDTKYLSVNDGLLRSCIYPGDKSFKRGSPTFPRSELRYLDEQVDGIYNISVDVKHVEAAPDMDYSVWQIFGNGPLVMNRKRFGKLQVVVFDGTPKFTEVSSFPFWCEVKCGVGGYVRCPSVLSFGDIDCGDSLHFKVGIYAQQMKPKSVTCAVYGGVSFDTTAYGDSITP